MSHCNTTCPYCGVGCGVRAEVNDGKLVSVIGDESHPANAGRLCVKGTALAETLGSEGRLLHPTLAGSRISWDTALDGVADCLRDTLAQHGPDAIAFYLSGQLLTEDYYVANKLMKGFLGSANVDTNSRLCMSSAVAAYKRAFGADLVPCTYDDVDDCDLLVMVGSNAAWTHPVIYQRIVAAKADNPNKRIVVVDTRRTASCDIADLHLQIAPGSDGFLFGGLLNHLNGAGAFDKQYITNYTEGLEDTLRAVADLDRRAVLKATGLTGHDLDRFYEWFAVTASTVTLYSQGINQSATGTDKCNAIINCHLATGRLGKAGAGPFSITGQPNAMGGREVGGLSNQLAAHMDFRPADIDRVGRFWNATDMATEPGLKAVDMFQAAADGEIKFLWIMATNPAVSLPDSAMVRRALQRCDFVVVSDCTAQTDTAALADLLLPAAGWGEKDGTVTNSERYISRQRALVVAPGEAQSDWWAITQVARRLGFEESFPYTSPADIFREHAALSGFENTGERDFDIGALADLTTAGYNNLKPCRWPLPRNRDAVEPLTDGHFFTESTRAQFVPATPELPQSRGGLILNTGRLRDQWHTMTHTGRVPRLSRHRDFFSLSISPQDAMQKGLREGDLALLSNSQGEVCGPVTVDQDLPLGQIFAPIHWSEQFSGQGKVSELISAVTDPVSGQPQSKFSDVALARVAVKCWGLLFSRQEIRCDASRYWSRIAVKDGYLTLLAETVAPHTCASGLLPTLQHAATEPLQYIDETHGDFREIGLVDGELSYALFLNRDRKSLPQKNWMADIYTLARPGNPSSLLAGFNPDSADVGRLICSCWEIGENEIIAAVQKGAKTAEQLGEKLRCGTQCGSCIPELKVLLQN
jgi:assimilatory nitrate reductase catalytic subunit